MASTWLLLGKTAQRKAAHQLNRQSWQAKRRERRRRLLLESLEPRLVLDGALHNVAAALIDVVQNDTGNNATSVTVTAPVAMNDFRIRAGSNRGDYNVQIGPGLTDDVPGGILMTSISENGRDNGEATPAAGVVHYGTSMLDGSLAGGYFIPVADTSLSGYSYSGGNEYNFDAAAAWFPYADGWLGGWARNAAGTNG